MYMYYNHTALLMTPNAHVISQQVPVVRVGGRRLPHHPQTGGGDGVAPDTRGRRRRSLALGAYLREEGRYTGRSWGVLLLQVSFVTLMWIIVIVCVVIVWRFRLLSLLLLLSFSSLVLLL